MLNRVPNGIAVLVGVKVVARLLRKRSSIQQEAVATGRMSPRIRIAAGRLIVFFPRTAHGENSAELVPATLGGNIFEGFVGDWVDVCPRNFGEAGGKV